MSLALDVNSHKLMSIENYHSLCSCVNFIRWPSRIGSRQEFKARESLSLSVCGDFFGSFLSWENIMYIMYTRT